MSVPGLKRNETCPFGNAAAGTFAGMADITTLILADHSWFREQFAELDYLQAQAARKGAALERVWRPLADKLDVHAYIEEKIFYPQLLQRGVDDPEGETLDAIGDHNDIRDGVRDANQATTGSDEWWAAVGRARKANDEHMGEEEREGLSDFRRHAPAGLREALGQQYAEFMAAHPTTRGLRIADRDPQAYVDAAEAAAGRPPKDTSLGIGSLKEN
jgi:Hemerythrin HHE cation binding domain